MAAPRKGLAQLAITGSAGLVVGGFTVIASASYAALIFHGPLAGYVAEGLWMALITAVVAGSLVALMSSCPGAIAIPQDRVAPILALLAASVVAQMPNAAPAQAGLVAVAAIVLVTLITGVALYALGSLRLGNLIRYTPYPVIGGFLAGSGWLLVLGGIRVMTGHPVQLKTLSDLLLPAALAQWLTGVCFGIAVFAVFRRSRHPLAMPMALLLGIALFYLWMGVSGTSVAHGRVSGWLPAAPQEGELRRLTSLSVLKVASWSLVLDNANLLATILLTSVVSILLTASALELVAHQEIDLNTELRSAGLATFIAGLGGGMVGFHSLSLSRLALSMGARTRWVGVVSAAVCFVAIFFGASVVSFVPQFVRGGLLFFLGLVFLWEWVYEGRRKLTRLDYCVVLIILAVVAAVGYTEGVATGITAAVLLFVHNYSRVDVVSRALSGANLRSNVDRPVADVRLLRERGDQILVLRLQGFIFFGTANQLLNEVRDRARNGSLPPLRFVIMDFRQVTGVDSSAIFSLWKVHQLATKSEFILLMTQVPPDVHRQLEMSGFREIELKNFYALQDLDHGLEYCEEILLDENRAEAGNNSHVDLADQLKDIWPPSVPADRLLPYLTRQEVPKGEHLIRQSENSECLYFIEKGQVTARLELDNGRSVRLRSQGPGTVVGEVGLFLGGRRAASVVTEEASTVYCLSGSDLQRMRGDDPALALAFHQFIVCLLAERLTSSSKMLGDYQK